MLSKFQPNISYRHEFCKDGVVELKTYKILFRKNYEGNICECKVILVQQAGVDWQRATKKGPKN